MGLNEKLMRIQTELKCPKNLYNSFGKYKYRNAEGICESVKPFLKQENCNLTITDQICEVGSRIYVKAAAMLTDNETGESVHTEAWAREPAEKKGMDESQITGAASSYARKYALNGLFLLDDTKDPDTDEYTAQAKKEETEVEALAKEKISDVMALALKARCEKELVPEHLIHSLYHVTSFGELNNKQYRNISDNWTKILEKAKGDK